MNLGPSNRDELRWEHPKRFEIRREPKQHMAFVYGALAARVPSDAK